MSSLNPVPKKSRASRVLVGAGALASLLLLTACGGGSGPGNSTSGAVPGGGGAAETLRIAAATELADVEPLIVQASRDLGFDIELSFPDGTLANSHSLHAGEFDGIFDATWFATNRYVDLLGASGKLGESTRIATSPVAFGVRSDKATELGWVDQPPTWAEIAEKAAAGEITYGMTDPASSNSGFSAVVAVATAMADTGNALNSSDIADNADALRDFFSGQKLASGSSGWLRDSFLADPTRVDALLNYESVLHSMVAEGADIEVILPADGVISADYPLSTLAAPEDEQAARQVRELVGWLNEHADLLADTYRRPAAAAELPAAMSDRILIELPFPGDIAVTDQLISTYTNELRVPGEIIFVLDTSGSMSGARLEELQLTMNQLINGSADTAAGSAALRERERVTILPFASEVAAHTTVTFGEARATRELETSVAELVAGGETALYAALQRAYEQIGQGDEDSIPSIVLLTDGQVTAGPDFEAFSNWFEDRGEHLPPTFVIRYGEADPTEMEQIADLTEGRTFEAGNDNLNATFREIRGYQ